MSKPIVYLAGPIAGISGLNATVWRQQAEWDLRNRGIETLSPMRAKGALSDVKRIATDFREYEKEGAFYTSRGIMARDFSDVKRCDALLVNLIGAGKSAGTIMELAWAYALQKPAVVVIDAGNVHLTHPMLFEAMPFRADSMDEAIDTVAVILGR